LKPNKPAVPNRVEVFADEGFENRAPEGLVQLAAQAALAAEHRAGPDRVTVLISGDDRLRSLNKEFLGEDEVTDVLSFNESPGWRNGTPPADSDAFAAREDMLGEIVVSLPQAIKQAVAARHSLERELATLTVHGVLHLLGYDHAGPDEERTMFSKADRVIENLFESGALQAPAAVASPLADKPRRAARVKARPA
jgi:probable rRNA maturation factor